jgi:hypothetical protein
MKEKQFSNFLQLQRFEDVLNGITAQVEELKRSIYVLKLQSDVFNADHHQLNLTLANEKTVIHDLASLTKAQ